jgi:hypothetical protein
VRSEDRLKVHGALFTVAALFSLNYIISKFGMRAFSPLSFAWLRVPIAASPFSPSSAWSRIRRSSSPDSR